MKGGARHYAVRRVNPFEGVLQVIEHALGRAYSPNGRIWQIQVLAERPSHTWRSLGHSEPVIQYFNFGLWNESRGLHRVPANPIMDIGAMNNAARALTDELQGLTNLLPLPLIDRHECWATDPEGLPLALLASTENPSLIGEIRADRWQAARAADRGAEAQARADQLEELVRRNTQARHWFRRRDDGSGLALDAGNDAAPLAAATFPALGLKAEWARADERALVDDYLAWLAPALLTLQHLDDEQRAGLEVSACKRAVALDEHWRMLPRVIDAPSMEAARVEARLRRAAS